METADRMADIFSPEAGWQTALAGAVGTFVALVVLRLIIEGMRGVLTKLGRDVEELTYVPPEMPQPQAAPAASQAAPRAAEAAGMPAPAAASTVEEAPAVLSHATAPAAEADMGATVAAIACAIWGQEATTVAAPAVSPSSPAEGIRSPWCMAGRLNLIHREPKKRTQ